MIRGRQARWGACSRTVQFDEKPFALACWNSLIAVGLKSGIIITIDPTTGICTSTLSGHNSTVKALAFSSDGISLVSGSYDGTVRLWDIQTGGVVGIFHGHVNAVWSVSISPDHTTIASGSLDKTIRLWNVQTGECHCAIDGHTDRINSVSFSPTNSQQLISASWDKTTRLWDIDGHQIGSAHQGCFAAFSPDGVHFISWGEEVGGKVATVWNSNSGEIVTKIQSPAGDLGCCCFSPNAKFVASVCGGASYGHDGTIYIWDITSSNPCHTQILVGPTWGITPNKKCVDAG